MAASSPSAPLRSDDGVPEPFQAPLSVPQAHKLGRGHIHEIEIGETTVDLAMGLTVPAWGYGLAGRRITSPGPLLEVEADCPVVIRWKNRLPASRLPGGTIPDLPFSTSLLDPPDKPAAQGDPQNRLGAEGGDPEPMLNEAPIGWTSVHLHGGHSPSNSDGWPDNMTQAGDSQLVEYPNTSDNADLGLRKVGPFQWYHDHAMNGTGYHVFAGLFGGYLVRDPAEAELGLPTCGDEGELVLIIQDRNLETTNGRIRYIHKTTRNVTDAQGNVTSAGTAEFFGPLTVVNQRLWPRLELRPAVYRLRLLNGSNARVYRLHLVVVDPAVKTATPQGDRLKVIGTEGGLLWKAWSVGPNDSLTLAPAERLDVLLDLTGLPAGAQLHLMNSAQAPFDGLPPFSDQDPPDATHLYNLWANGAADPEDRNPYPRVMRFDVNAGAAVPGMDKTLFDHVGDGVLNPAFRRLLHVGAKPEPTDGPPLELPTDHEHRLIVLAESPPGTLFLQELVPDPSGKIQIQLPGQAAQNFRVDGWMPGDTAASNSRNSFIDRIAIRPEVRKWEVWRFLNTTADAHPLHIHQSTFQPLGPSAVVMTADPLSYDPEKRVTARLIKPDHTRTGRRYDPFETSGWKDVIRVHPSELVEVAIRFDTPGRYVYHCHILEHEDNVMMRPFVVTVMPMDDGMGSM